MDEFENKVRKVVDVIRPAIQADGGDIILVSTDTRSGLVEIELTGSCTDCSIVGATVDEGIERILIKRVAGVKKVVNTGVTNSESTWKPEKIYMLGTS